VLFTTPHGIDLQPETRIRRSRPVSTKGALYTTRNNHADFRRGHFLQIMLWYTRICRIGILDRRGFTQAGPFGSSAAASADSPAAERETGCSRPESCVHGSANQRFSILPVVRSLQPQWDLAPFVIQRVLHGLAPEKNCMHGQKLILFVLPAREEFP